MLEPQGLAGRVQALREHCVGCSRFVG
jgi:hypothetical protein